MCVQAIAQDIIGANGFDRPSIRIHLGFRAGMNKPRRAKISEDFCVFSLFAIAGCSCVFDTHKHQKFNDNDVFYENMPMLPLPPVNPTQSAQ